jgi:hypothetical protein
MTEGARAAARALLAGALAVLLGVLPAGAAETLLVAQGGDVVAYPTAGRPRPTPAVDWAGSPPDARGQVCFLPGGGGSFVVAYGPPTATPPSARRVPAGWRHLRRERPRRRTGSRRTPIDAPSTSQGACCDRGREHAGLRRGAGRVLRPLPHGLARDRDRPLRAGPDRRGCGRRGLRARGGGRPRDALRATLRRDRPLRLHRRCGPRPRRADGHRARSAGDLDRVRPRGWRCRQPVRCRRCLRAGPGAPRGRPRPGGARARCARAPLLARGDRGRGARRAPRVPPRQVAGAAAGGGRAPRARAASRSGPAVPPAASAAARRARASRSRAATGPCSATTSTRAS